MSDRITVEELAELMKKAAGVTVAPDDLQRQNTILIRGKTFRFTEETPF